MFFNSWEAVLQVAIITPFTYFALVLLLRVSGKRTLSKMNMFDFVITIALGSAFATVILSKNVALAEGMVAIGSLIYLQYIVAWISARNERFRELVKGDPTLLFYDGQFLGQTILDERVSREEIYASIRAQGIGHIQDVNAVILETDGSLSVIGRHDAKYSNALRGIEFAASDKVDKSEIVGSQP